MALLCGPKSADNIARFNRELQNKALQETSSHLGERLENYQPWMSHVEHRQAFSKLYPFLDYDQSAPTIVHGENLAGMSDIIQRKLAGLAFLDQKAANFALASHQDQQTESFVALVESVLKFNKAHCPNSWKRILSSVTHIIPVVAKDPAQNPSRRDGSGFSNHLFRGAVFLSLPRVEDTAFFELALNLIHECGHQALMVYQCSDEILNEDLSSPIYSVIRKTERPAILSFHAAIATAYMVEWLMEAADHLKGRVSDDVISVRWTRLIHDLNASLGLFTGRKFTPLGKIMFAEMQDLAKVANERFKGD